MRTVTFDAAPILGRHQVRTSYSLECDPEILVLAYLETKLTRNNIVVLHLSARSLIKNNKDMTSRSFSEDDADYFDRNRGPIEQLLSEAVSEVMREEPTDPFQYLADYLARRALEERQRNVICVSDIHGRCDELKALWDALTKELGEELARTPVVFLGECVLRSALESHVARREPRLNCRAPADHASRVVRSLTATAIAARTPRACSTF